MVVDPGVTLRIAGLAVAFCVNPSDQVRAQGAVPPKATWTVALLPEQIVVVPVTVAVGRALTIKVAAVENAIPHSFVKRARYCFPLSPVTGTKEYVLTVAPAISSKVPPPSRLTCH